MATFTDILARAKITAPDPDVSDLEVPVLTGPQRQGDVLIIPDNGAHPTGTPVPRVGVAVVRGEATGNTHLLQCDGDVTWAPAALSLVLGYLDVGDGATAYLIHTDEHGVNAIGPGRYILTGKREQADEIRRVAD